jgi:arylsulfatase A-like enzyme
VYTQPQNVHISVIQRERASVPDGEAYPGFYAPYASRLKRIDAAFGKFIEFLKARNLYDHSIIVLTADHGDSLGEGGRWGHSYTLFPEILRIPLIVHLPKDLRAGVSCDPAAVAFSTDITPTLYYLLGHRPIRKNAVFGSPLFAKTPAERIRDSQASYLLASSYAAVYGILSNNGRRLYLADGVNYQHFLFDLDGASTQSRPVNPSIEQEQDALIRKGILDINGFYRFEGAERTQP